MADGDVHAIANRTSVDTSHSNTSCVAGVIQRRDEHLRRTLKDAWSRNNFQNLVEQIVNIVRRSFEIWTHPAILGRTIDDGEVQLVLCRIEITHQVEDHLIDFLRAAVGLVHLVDHHDGLQTYLQGLLKHETGLRHRALKGIDKEQTTIGHIEHALHLSTEIRVTRRVEDIDFHTFPVDTDVLTQNGYTALSLQIVGVEHFTAVILSIAEEFAREHHLIDQRCLAVIDMCNDCNVTNILHFTLNYRRYGKSCAKVRR